MAIIGFNFTKISAEKPKGKLTGKVNVNNNISITDVKEIEVSLSAKDTRGLSVEFEYVCAYEPAAGKVVLQGHVVTVENQDTIQKAFDSWKKDKSLGKELTTQVMSYVLGKASVQAIILSRDVGLPAPVPLPKIEKPTKKK